MCHFSLYISGQFMQPNSALLWSTWPRAFLKEYLLAPISWKCRNVQPKNIAGVGKYTNTNMAASPGLGFWDLKPGWAHFKPLSRPGLNGLGLTGLGLEAQPGTSLTLTYSDILQPQTPTLKQLQLWHIALKFQWLWNYDNFDLLMLSEFQLSSKFFDKFGVTTFFWSDLVNFG
jgi:hypothetical protein